MFQRITLRDIAERAGVHFTTVSRALRNHPSIPEATRAEIKALAEQMGYTPDPFVSALNAYRLAKQRVSFHGMIGWLDGYPAKFMRGNLYQGAKRRAAELGYQLERFELGSQSLREFRSLDRMLAARNIRSVVVHPLNANTHIDLDWKRYSAIAVGHQLVSPRLHLITNDQLANLMLAMQKLTALGYRRIGLLLERRLIDITGRRWLAGYLVEREHTAPKDRLEFLVFDEPVSTARLQQWFRKNKPDAVITETFFWLHRLHGDLGLECPRDIGVAVVAASASQPFAGIAEDTERVGTVAIEQLVRMEHGDERGLPAHPLHTFIEGEWRSGSSVTTVT